MSQRCSSFSAVSRGQFYEKTAGWSCLTIGVYGHSHEYGGNNTSAMANYEEQYVRLTAPQKNYFSTSNAMAMPRFVSAHPTSAPSRFIRAR